MGNKGLGTGLGALFGDAASEETVSDFEYISIRMIEPRQDQPRVSFEQEKIDELAESIREHGILSPLTVRRMNGGYCQIIAGERRWRAARAVGLEEIPVRIIEADERKTLELSLIENLQREGLTPIEEARGYRALMDEFGMTQEEVAQRVSKSRPTVANALRLLSLPEELVELIGKGELSAGSARALLSLKSDDLMHSAAKKAVDDDLSVREVELLVKKMGKEKPEQEKPEQEKPGIEMAEGAAIDYLGEAKRRLETALGRRVTIKQGKDRGSIEIEYYGQDDFDELFDILSSARTANAGQREERGLNQ